jgi:Ca2+-binding RTX toxin-like protein
VTGSTNGALTSIEWVKGTAQNDAVVLSGVVANRVDAGAGNDAIYDLSGATSDTIIGGAGTDTLTYDIASAGQFEVDLIAGTVTYNSVVDYLSGIERIVTETGNDRLLGDARDNYFWSSAGNDTQFGDAGADSLDGGDGADSLDGGIGNDYLYGGAGDNTLFGGDGTDRLYGQGSTDSGATGDDYIDGGADNDIVWGGRGNDTLLGGAGADYIHGGGYTTDIWSYEREWGTTGADVLDGGTGNDTLMGGDGNDLIFGGDDHDRIGLNYSGSDFSEYGNDTLIGGAGNDTIIGGFDDDLIYGGDGADTLGDTTYEYGNDTFIGGLGNDTIYGGDYAVGSYFYDRDTLDYSGSTDSVQVNLDDEAHAVNGGTLSRYMAIDGLGGVDTIYGIENVIGGSDHDVLLGSSIANSLVGNAGNDTIWGAEGADTLIGGDGNDVFFLDLADTSVDGGNGSDTLYTRYVNTDLTQGGIASITNIEVIDLSANAAGVGNSLVLNQATVASITGLDSGSTYRLRINGEVGDSVFFEDYANWTVGNEVSGYRSFEYTANSKTYIVEVAVAVSTDVVRGVVSTAETLSEVRQKDSGSTLVDSKTMADYSDRIDAVRVNLSSDIDNGVAPRTAVTTAVDSGAVDVDTFTLASGSTTLSQVEWVKTGSGDDWIVGSSVANRLEGGLGDDWLRGGEGNDTLVGGLGTDTADYSDANAGVDITLNSDYTGSVTSSGSIGTDTLDSIEHVVGSSFADRIDINDTIANWIDGGAGADTILAGAGDDTIIYDSADVSVDGEAGTDVLVIRDATLDLSLKSGSQINNIEVLDVRGSGGTHLTLSVDALTNLSTDVNTLTVHADSQDIVDLVGAWTRGSVTGSGDELYRTWTGTNATLSVSAEATVRLSGTANAESVSGSTSNDLILGLAGNDTLNGNAGDDTFIGGASDDSIVGGDGFDTVDYSGAAAITLDLTAGTVSGDGTDTLSGIEAIVATAFADSLKGSASDDVLYGGLGNDSFAGEAGDDRLYGEAGNDSILGGDGSDFLDGGAGADTLHGGAGVDALLGGLGDDRLILDILDSRIDGGMGTDTLEISDSTVDFTSGGLPEINGIEILDIENSATTAVTLDLQSVRALSGESDQLWIVADDADTISLTDFGSWAASTPTHENGTTTQILTQDGVMLKITNTGVAVTDIAEVFDDTPIGSGSTYVGTESVDSLTGSGLNDTFTPSSGADVITGGDGIDTIQLGPQFRVDTISLGVSVESQNNSYLVALGDVNADGFMDFAMRDADSTNTSLKKVYRNDSTDSHGNYSYSISLTSENASSGDVYVVYGAADGLGNLAINSSEAQSGSNAAFIKLSSTASANEGFGDGLGSLGDFDGDGIDDFMVLASGGETMDYVMGNTTTHSLSSDRWNVSSEGRVYVFNGGNATISGRESGSVTETTLGTSGGDGATINADALPTTAVSNYWNSRNSSYVPQYANEVPGEDTTYSYVTSSTTADVVFKGSSSNSNLGYNWSPVSLGDIDGDGFDDIISGNTAEIFFGKVLTDSGFNSASSGLGTAVDLGTFNRISSLGDVDGDGLDDFLASSDSGVTSFIIWGATDASSWTAPSTWETNFAAGTVPHMTEIVPETGFSINGSFSALGDINGDGFDDILLSAYGTDANDFNAKDNGGLYVVFGQAAQWNQTDLSLTGLAENQLGFRITGAVDLDQAGRYSWTGVGDMNGDGLDDFIFQAPGDAEADNAGTTSNGSSYLMFGRESGWQDISLLEMQDYGIQLLDTPNGLWTALGDVDGDGFDDVSLTQSTSMQIMYGGAFLTSDSNQAVQSIQGTGGETLTANAAVTSPNPTGADRLIGNAGNDTLVGDGGLDVLIGGAGNDLLKVASTANGAFFKLDGGTGIDTVEFTTAINLNFTDSTVAGATDVRNGAIENIEIFKLGAGNQTLTLSHLDVIAMTGEKNTAIDNTAYQKGNVLVIDAGAGDAVDLEGTWTDTTHDTSVNGAGSFSVYQFGSDNIYAVISDEVTANTA